MGWTKEKIERFIGGVKWNGYQEIKLPHGLVIPGVDRSDTFEAIYPDGCTGKKILDVGCHYGAIMHMALEAGAARVVGLEARPQYAELNRKITEIIGDGAVCITGNIERHTFKERFHDVLLLNVIHHIHEPVATLRKAASLARQRLVIEWATLEDYQGRFGEDGRFSQKRPIPDGLEDHHVLVFDPFKCWWWTEKTLEAVLREFCFRVFDHKPSPKAPTRRLTICRR